MPCAPSPPCMPVGRPAQIPIAEIYDRTGGVPAAVHRWSSAWARTRPPRGSRRRPAHVGRPAATAGRGGRVDRRRRRPRAGARADASSTPPTDVRRRAVHGRGRAPGRLPVQGPRRLRRRRCRVLLRPRAARRRARRAARRGSFLGLVGASGSGKSSALRAGLLPALAGGVLPGSAGWRSRACGRASTRWRSSSVRSATTLDDDAARATSPAGRPSGARRRPVRGGLQLDAR